VTGNLLSSETTIFLSVHVGGEVFETEQTAVMAKQQCVELDTEFTMNVPESLIVADPKSKLGTIPISIRLNRRGLMDSDVLAVGRVMAHISSNPSTPIKVGLMTSEENTEIASLDLSITATPISGHDPTIIASVIREIERLMHEYENHDDTQTPVTEVFQRFLVSVTPVRVFLMQMVDLLTWKSYPNSLLFLTTLWVHPWGIVFVFPVLLFAVSDNHRRSDLHILKSLSVLFKPTTNEDSDTILEHNLSFLSTLMNWGISVSSWHNRTRVEFQLVLIAAVFIIPNGLVWLITLYMLSLTSWAEAFRNIFRTHLITSPPPEPITPSEGIYSLYENQRWWLGKWSEKLLSHEGVPSWQRISRSGRVSAENAPKESFILPSGDWRWSGPWEPETSDLTDKEGWQYGQDFVQRMKPKRELTDFVRRRKWTRQFEKKNLL
jgi:hypothetical protein